MAILCLAACAFQRVRADVIVLANRTESPIPIRFVPVSGAAQQLSIPALETVPMFLDGRADLTFASKSGPKHYSLDANSAYYFGRSQDGRVDMQKIGLGDDGTAADGRKLPGNASRAPTVMIPVKILVDEDEPAKPAYWERRLRSRLEAASAILEKHCRVGFKVVAVETWTSDNSITDFFDSLAEFERKVDPKPAKLAIGFTSQWPMVRGRVHMAGTRGPLHSHILVREGSPEIIEPERLEFLVHELGHYLGAAHSPEADSVMRPVLGDKLVRRANFRVQFDPVNTLAMAMICEEIRRTNLTRITELQYTTRRRLEQIYMELARSIPDDPAGMHYAMLMRTAETPVAKAAKQVLQRIVSAAIENRALAPPLPPGEGRGEGALAANGPPSIDTVPKKGEIRRQREGDALTEYYIREAARIAGTLPSDLSSQAFLIGAAIGLDESNSLAAIPNLVGLLRTVELPSERMTRLAVLGRPTMRGRPDLVQHFFASAFLTAVAGADAAQAVALDLELQKAKQPGGFSFRAVAADRAGSRFAKSVLEKRSTLATLASTFAVVSFMPEVDSLPDGLSESELRSRFGTKIDPRFFRQLEEIDQRVLLLPGYRRDSSISGKR